MDACLRIMENLQSETLDVLLTHDGLPNAVKAGKGSSQLTEVAWALNPQYHFFGHYHRSIAWNDYASRVVPPSPQRDSTNWRTRGIHINKLAFQKEGDLLRAQVAASMAVADGLSEVTFLEDDWLGRIKRTNWWHIG